MKRFFRLLFEHEGDVSGRAYLYTGALLFGFKYLLDLLVVRFTLDRVWMPWDYLNLQWRDIDFRDREVVQFAALMLALAFPFIWSGVVLTLKRLRRLSWPASLVCLFFVPYLNILFFLLLAFFPNRRQSPHIVQEGEPSHAVSLVLFISACSIALIYLSAELLENYGWGLFVGIPFAIGFASGLLRTSATSRPLFACIALGWAIEGVVGAALIVFAMEGVICLLMAAPLAMALSAFGSFVGFMIRRNACITKLQRDLYCATGAMLMPLLLMAEKAAAPSPVLIPVSTSLEISAPLVTVWKHVVTFSELPPATEWIFRLGVAHPVRAEISGMGPGAVRHCVFSTGVFVEPIEIWDEPRLLRFSVTSNPPPMQEFSFWDVAPPHMDGFLLSERGQFALSEIAPGRTRLEGTTWYRHNLWPERYWQLWSDYIIHTIHLRVLRHIKSEAETESFI